MSKYYLGIDQGTTGVTSVVFDESFRPLSRGYKEISLSYPADGCVERDAAELWQGVCDSTAEALRDAEISSADIAAIGIDHEGETALMWDSVTGRPICPAISWQDRRTAAVCRQLDEQHGSLIRERTALAPSSYFSATKLWWMYKNVPEAAVLKKQGRLRAGNMDAWILWNMTGGRTHATDASTASRTMLYDICRGEWDEDICRLMELDASVLPAVGDSFRPLGKADPRCFLGISAPITGVLNDQQSALLGQGCIKPGMLKTTYGTGCFMLVNTGDTPVRSNSGIVTTVAWQAGDIRTYALDGGIYVSGAAVQWLRDGIGIIDSASQCSALALSVKDNGGLYFVPAFSGLAAPYWDPCASGIMVGLDASITRAHMVRAASESTAYQVYDLLGAVRRDTDLPVESMLCDGGAVRDKFLMQFQSDILGIPLEVPEFPDATSLGAAFAAAVGLGEAELSDIRSIERNCRRYEPRMSEDNRQTLLSEWHRAVERSLNWKKI